MQDGKIKNGATAPGVPHSSLPPFSRLSFSEAIGRVAEQVGYADICFDAGRECLLERELCAIIAEVYMLRPDREIRISGEWLDAEMVQSVFRELRREHIEAVATEFGRLTVEIRNKKAYLRTSLYNSVFTLSAHYTNKVNFDLSKK